MHVEDIKAGLRKQGVTLTELAERLNVTPGTVSIVLKNRRSARIEQAVAELLNIPLSRIWPARYRNRRRPGA